MSLLVCALICLQGAVTAAAPVTLTPLPITLPEAHGLAQLGSARWGDFDNDGDLDLLLTGVGSPGGFQTKTIVLRNDNGTFVDILGTFINVDYSTAAWGDYDNDGYLDFAVAGLATGYVATIYRNNGNGSFSETGIPIGSGAYGSIAWGDYDHDGDLDLLITGRQSSGNASHIYRNDGSGVFTDIHAPLVDVFNSAGLWVDYDNDGDLDVLITGESSRPVPQGNLPITKLYRNDGQDLFVDTLAPLLQVGRGTAAWGDYDNDGDLDLAIAGDYDLQNSGAAKIYRNDSGVLKEVSNLGPVKVAGFSGWADYDNDGDLDLLLGNSTGVFRNEGADHFVFVDMGLAATYESDGSWGDYDKDGDVDLLIRGYFASPPTVLYQSNGASPNTAPSAPTGLSAVREGNLFRLSWLPSEDSQTPSAGLSYNVCIGSTPGASDLLSPMSDPATGFRRVPQIGNAQSNTFFLFSPHSSGNFYWRVQAIDGAFAGSPFSQEDSASAGVPALPAVMSTSAANGEIRVTWYAHGSGAGAATVYRRTAGTDWITLGVPSSDGASLLTFEDKSVEPAIRYAYRLGISASTGETFTEEVWAELPSSALEFAIQGVKPNPASERLQVSFSIPVAGPARLEAFDVAGRSVAFRDVSALGAGTHEVSLAGDRKLPSGVYLIRLSWMNRALTKRAVVAN
jgi:predicted nucleotidyltransferase